MIIKISVNVQEKKVVKYFSSNNINFLKDDKYLKKEFPQLEYLDDVYSIYKDIIICLHQFFDVIHDIQKDYLEYFTTKFVKEVVNDRLDKDNTHINVFERVDKENITDYYTSGIANKDNFSIDINGYFKDSRSIIDIKKEIIDVILENNGLLDNNIEESDRIIYESDQLLDLLREN